MSSPSSPFYSSNRRRQTTSATGSLSTLTGGSGGGVISSKRRRHQRDVRGEGGSGGGRGVVAMSMCVIVSLWAALVMRLVILPSDSDRKRGGGGAARVRRAGAKDARSASDSNAGANANASADSTSDDRDPRILALRPSTPNPYEGWQPPISDGDAIDGDNRKECGTWRVCFRKDHQCPMLCRDGASALGPAPLPPLPDAPGNANGDGGGDGWIPDVTVLRRMYLRGIDSDGHPWPPPLPDVMCEDVSFNGGTNGDVNKRCFEEIGIVAEPLDKSEEEARNTRLVQPMGIGELGKTGTNGKVFPKSVPMPRVMCLMYTMESEHATRVRAVRETWAGGCDGFLAFSTASDPRIPAISIPHEGPEEYTNMWQKVRSIWKFVGTHYLNDFDYFFIGGDDLFVMPQNLREYLWTLGSADDDHFVGRRFKSDTYFNSGGAGYALSRGTLRRLLNNMDDNMRCSPHSRTSMEDVMIARCLDSLGIGLTDTRDHDGRERFHPFSPGTHLTWKYPKVDGGERDWYDEYNKEWGLKLGKDCCAPDSVSWHYMKKPAMVRHIYSLLYLCDGDKSRMKNMVARGNLRKRDGVTS